jgi:hypothetical protein
VYVVDTLSSWKMILLGVVWPINRAVCLLSYFMWHESSLYPSYFANGLATAFHDVHFFKLCFVQHEND